MAGLFNIFSESENVNSLSSSKGKEKSQNVKLAKLKTIGTASYTSSKIFTPSQSQSKSKGLSIRSKSDLNVSISTNSGFSKHISKDYINLEDKSNISKKSSLSPVKLKTPKKKSFANVTTKKLSPKISSPIMQNVVDEFVFAKPGTPKPLKKYPEPEVLACYSDPIKLMKAEMECTFNADLLFIKSVSNNDDSLTSLEDEGFISDSEQDSFCHTFMEPSIPSFNDIDFGLPDISDEED